MNLILIAAEGQYTDQPLGSYLGELAALTVPVNHDGCVGKHVAVGEAL